MYKSQFATAPPDPRCCAAQKAANKSLNQACGALNNKDIKPFIPVLVTCLANPAEVPQCVHKLASTTFVQAVESPELAMMAPLLLKGLSVQQTTPIKRKSSLIVDNMAKVGLGRVPMCLPASCQLASLPADEQPPLNRLKASSAMICSELGHWLLPQVCGGAMHCCCTTLSQHALTWAVALQLVEQPAHAAVFLPNVLPLVTRVSQEVSNPECREVATQAVKTLEHLKTELDAVTKANEDITTAVSCFAVPVHLFPPASCTQHLLQLHSQPDPSSCGWPAAYPCWTHFAIQKRALTPASSFMQAVLDIVAKLAGFASHADIQGSEVTALKYAADLCFQLTVSRTFRPAEWVSAVTPFLAPYIGQTEAHAVAEGARTRCDPTHLLKFLDPCGIADVCTSCGLACTYPCTRWGSWQHACTCAELGAEACTPLCRGVASCIWAALVADWPAEVHLLKPGLQQVQGSCAEG